MTDDHTPLDPLVEQVLKEAQELGESPRETIDRKFREANEANFGMARRKTALELALAFYHEAPVVGDNNVLDTAKRFDDFLRDGTVPEVEPDEVARQSPEVP